MKDPEKAARQAYIAAVQRINGLHRSHVDTADAYRDRDLAEAQKIYRAALEEIYKGKNHVARRQKT